jgi:hypothetical protein
MGCRPLRGRMGTQFFISWFSPNDEAFATIRELRSELNRTVCLHRAIPTTIHNGSRSRSGTLKFTTNLCECGTIISIKRPTAPKSCASYAQMLVSQSCILPPLYTQTCRARLLKSPQPKVGLVILVRMISIAESGHLAPKKKNSH